MDDKTESVVQLHPDVHGMMLQAAEAAVPPEPEPEPATPPATIPATAVATIPATEPGLPSQYLDHALNFITEIQIKGDAFKAGRDALVTELDGQERAFAATRDELRIKFDVEMEKLAEAHDAARTTLQERIANMDLGLDIVASAIKLYNTRVQPADNEEERE